MTEATRRLVAGALAASWLCACGGDTAGRGARAEPPAQAGPTAGTAAAPTFDPGNAEVAGSPGAAASITAPVAGGAAGSPAPDLGSAPPGPEPPTGVVFDWPETDPSQQMPCEPGHYVGTFMCSLYIVTTEGMPAFELSGTIDMQLEQTADGELLRIANGTFVSAAAVAIPAWGDVVGELDCSTRRFEGRLENGHFSVALGLPVPFTEGTFEGDLDADYDPTRAALENGAWNMVGELDFFPGTCMDGTWEATRVP